jgi:hypothetical protein
MLAHKKKKMLVPMQKPFYILHVSSINFLFI